MRASARPTTTLRLPRHVLGMQPKRHVTADALTQRASSSQQLAPRQQGVQQQHKSADPARSRSSSAAPPPPAVQHDYLAQWETAWHELQHKKDVPSTQPGAVKATFYRPVSSQGALSRRMHACMHACTCAALPAACTHTPHARSARVPSLTAIALRTVHGAATHARCQH
jgi:hypothetical protein